MRAQGVVPSCSFTCLPLHPVHPTSHLVKLPLPDIIIYYSKGKRNNVHSYHNFISPKEPHFFLADLNGV